MPLACLYSGLTLNLDYGYISRFWMLINSKNFWMDFMKITWNGRTDSSHWLQEGEVHFKIHIHIQKKVSRSNCLATFAFKLAAGFLFCICSFLTMISFYYYYYNLKSRIDNLGSELIISSIYFLLKFDQFSNDCLLFLH